MACFETTKKVVIILWCLRRLLRVIIIVIIAWLTVTIRLWFSSEVMFLVWFIELGLVPEILLDFICLANKSFFEDSVRKNKCQAPPNKQYYIKKTSQVTQESYRIVAFTFVKTLLTVRSQIDWDIGLIFFSKLTLSKLFMIVFAFRWLKQDYLIFKPIKDVHNIIFE